MGKCYFEIREKPARGNSVSTDIMRHLHTRQYLGRAIIVSTQPATFLSAARKQWLKLSRYIQKQRAATLDADKILKYTHTVTHMQHMRFSAKSALEEPDTDVYFLDPASLHDIPPNCWTIYLTTQLTEHQLQGLLSELPAETLLVDYTADHDFAVLDVQPKHKLEANLDRAWQQLEQFLGTYNIDVKELAAGPLQDVDAMEVALDVLLGASHKFLQVAGNFQHALELARPLRLSKGTRQQYDAATLLAHRVQALSTNGFTGQFLESYNEDDTFFLYDIVRELQPAGLAEAIARQMAAGRYNLAEALKQQSANPTLHPGRQQSPKKLFAEAQPV